MSLFDKEKPKRSEKPRFQYLAGDWDVWITDGTRKVKLAYHTHRLYGRHPKTESVLIPWTWELLQMSMSHIQRVYATAYSGKWDLMILDAERIPYPLDRPIGAREKNEAIMLADSYPDTPGKRFLQKLKGGEPYSTALGGLMSLPTTANVKPPDRVAPPSDSEQAELDSKWEH